MCSISASTTRWRVLRGSVRKTLALRVLHALLFEAGLVLVLVPFVAWYLGVGLYEAFLMDLALTVFFLVYAFLFNWAYDALFPLPSPATRRPPLRADAGPAGAVSPW